MLKKEIFEESKINSILTKEEILNYLTLNKTFLSLNFGVLSIGLFGSYSKNLENKDSDIDLAIEVKKKDFFLREDLKDYLEAVFKKKVDIGYLDSFRKFIKNKIEKEIIYA